MEDEPPGEPRISTFPNGLPGGSPSNASAYFCP